MQRRGGSEHAHHAANAHAYADGGSHRDAYPFAYSLSCPHANAHRNAYCYARSHADALSYPDAYAHAYPYADRDSDAYAYPNGDSHANAYAYADRDPDDHADPNPNRDSDDHADPYAGGVADAPSLRVFRLHRRRGHALVRAAPKRGGAVLGARRIRAGRSASQHPARSNEQRTRARLRPERERRAYLLGR